jgi:hypothetical protein
MTRISRGIANASQFPKLRANAGCGAKNARPSGGWPWCANDPKEHGILLKLISLVWVEFTPS